MHLELADELPTLDKVRELIADAEAMAGQSITLADLARATRDAVKNHANAQTGNALDIMRNALNRYEQTDISDTGAAWHQVQRMQSALDTIKTMEIFRL
jgi:hypothetical protein